MVESLPGMEAAQGSVSSLPSIITIKIILAIIYDAAADGKIQSTHVFSVIFVDLMKRMSVQEVS